MEKPAMMDEIKEKALGIVLQGSFSFSLNMNDTFGYALAHCEDMAIDDFEMISGTIARYGHAALVAYVAVKLDSHPLESYRTEDFKQACREIKEVKARERFFMKL